MFELLLTSRRFCSRFCGIRVWFRIGSILTPMVSARIDTKLLSLLFRFLTWREH
jgi:hypothetical protein